MPRYQSIVALVEVDERRPRWSRRPSSGPARSARPTTPVWTWCVRPDSRPQHPPRIVVVDRLGEDLDRRPRPWCRRRSRRSRRRPSELPRRRSPSRSTAGERTPAATSPARDRSRRCRPARTVEVEPDGLRAARRAAVMPTRGRDDRRAPRIGTQLTRSSAARERHHVVVVGDGDVVEESLALVAVEPTVRAG